MRKLRLVMAGAFFSLFSLSCEDDSSRYSDPSNLSEFARDYFQMMGGRNASFNQSSGAINGSYQRLLSNSGRSSGRTNDSTSIDTVLVAPLWVTCATTTVINNPDKSVTTIVDYGDGCEEGNEYFTQFVHGRYMYTSRSHVTELGPLRNEEYEYSFKSENYGGTYSYDQITTTWLTNGSSEYSGTSIYNESDNTYSGNFSSTVDDTYTYDGVEYSYKGSSKSSYNHKRQVTEESNYTARNGEDYYYSLVLEPLVMRFDCDAWQSLLTPTPGFVSCYFLPMYVSGKEFIKYKKDGKEGSFTVDWGNGLCDTKVIIEENGQYFKIDWANSAEIFNN